MTNPGKEFYQASEYCDFDDHEIELLARQIFNNDDSDKAKAIRAFKWVRDNIKYRVGLWNCTASETLREREGSCTNKANLFAALLRSAGIPAGFGIMRTNGQDYLGPIVIPVLRRRIGKVSTHIYSYVFLDGKWIRCDSSNDRELSEKITYLNPQSALLEWDGATDAMEKLDPTHILDDKGPQANIDDIMLKRPRNARGVIIKTANLYIQFLRENDIRVNVAPELEPLFYKWLRSRHEYILVWSFKVVSWYRHFLEKTTELFWAKYMREFDIMNRAVPYRRLIEETLDAGVFKSNDVVLDAGSGTGNFSIEIKKSGARVISVDYSEATLDAHKRKDKEAETVVHDLRYYLPFEDEYFTKVLCILTLHVFSPLDRERILKEFYRVLKPGGLIILANPSEHFSSTRIFKEHIVHAVKVEGFRRVLVDLLHFFAPITKMFWYNFVLEAWGVSGAYTYLKIGEQQRLLSGAGFSDVSKTKEIYSRSAILNTAIKK